MTFTIYMLNPECTKTIKHIFKTAGYISARMFWTKRYGFMLLAAVDQIQSFFMLGGLNWKQPTEKPDHQKMIGVSGNLFSNSYRHMQLLKRAS